MASRPAERRHGYHPTSLEVAQRRLADATTALRVAEAGDKGVEALAWGTIYAGAFIGLISIKFSHQPSIDELKEAIADELVVIARAVAWPVVAAYQGAGAAGDMIHQWLDNLTLGAAGKVRNRLDKERQYATETKSWSLTIAEAALIAATTVIALKVLMGGVRVRPG